MDQRMVRHSAHQTWCRYNCHHQHRIVPQCVPFEQAQRHTNHPPTLTSLVAVRAGAPSRVCRP